MTALERTTGWSPDGLTPVAAPAPPPATPPQSGSVAALYADPAFLAFVRSSGMGDEIAAGDVARQSAAVNMALGISTDDLNASGEKSRRNIAGSHEARGVFRSGANLRAQAEQEQAQGRAQAGLQLNAANSLGSLQTGLAQRIAGNQQRTAELGLTTTANQNLQTGIDKINSGA